VEYNHFRSFQGLTCLMQISTRTEDFIVDTLKLRKYLGERLREAFQDPTKKKVLLALSVILFFLLFIPIIQFSISLMTK
jgi:ribonuclease D